MSNLSIIIVGGGVAGLAAAIALRADHRTITVLEASSMDKEVGANISLQPNASQIAASWGLEPYLAARGCLRDNAFRILDLDGNVVMQVRNDTSTFAAARNCMHRVDLHSALLARATADTEAGVPVTVRRSSRVVTCDCENGIVTLKSGEQLRADVVVAADGIRSVVAEARPTGISAYRLLLRSADVEDIVGLPEELDPREAKTTIMMGHDKRLVMGPSRNGEVFGVVGLVPDEMMHEKSRNNSWTTPGSLDKALEAFADFPAWAQALFLKADDISLWQLRDTDPLQTWIRGRVILVGDAAHAMLPTQGQGAGQSFEDAEALGEFLADMPPGAAASDVEARLKIVEKVRRDRVSLIQSYSRQQAKPATESPTSRKVTLNPVEFNAFNCGYSGARDWQRRQEMGTAMPA